MGIVKTGYFRITGVVQSMVSYQEAYERGEEYLTKLRHLQENGVISLYCACCREDDLPLIVTKNNVIRVSHNLQQAQHLNSCPKSTGYASWVAENALGIRINEDEKILFNIAIPSGMKGTVSDRISPPAPNKNTNPWEKRTSIYDMVRIVNYLAFRKQTLSIRKQIGMARKDGNQPKWDYKDIHSFIKLWFGVSNEVLVHNKGETFPLHDLCYRSDVFFQSNPEEKFFMYALVDKVSEYKESRKYQYITVFMPSRKSRKKATVRIPTEDYDKMAKQVDFDNSAAKILTGYVRHDMYRTAEDSEDREWITLIKGVIVEVSERGLILEQREERALFDVLCKEHILFYRPWRALENYGNEIPTLIIERMKNKNLIVDLAKSDKDFVRKETYGVNNSEFEVLLLKKDYDIEDVIGKIRVLVGMS